MKVLKRGEAGFAEEVSGFDLLTVHSPELVVAAASVGDVVEAVRLGKPVSVLSTGHGAGAPVARGVMISTRGLKGVRIDGNRAIVGAGEKWGAVIAAAGPHGLAPISGSSPGVGVVGLIGGGGFGPLSRAFGLASDWVRRLQVVTATGDVVTASATENPGLFWAFLGGKVGLGLVTEVELELVPIPSLYAGSLAFDSAHVDAVVRAWAEWTRGLPENACTSIAIMRLPDSEFIPALLRGKTTAAVRFAMPGAGGEATLAPMRAAAPVLVDQVGVMPLANVAQIHSDPTAPTNVWVRGAMLRDGFASKLIEVAGASADVPFVAIEVRQLGGAIRREGTAVGGRDAEYMLTLVGAPNPRLFVEVTPVAAARIFTAVAPWTLPVTSLNLATAPMTSRADYDACFSPAQAQRLAAERETWDPAGVFRPEFLKR